jgi:hypothetical protein
MLLMVSHLMDGMDLTSVTLWASHQNDCTVHLVALNQHLLEKYKYRNRKDMKSINNARKENELTNIELGNI